jgi:hypothetical protein
VPDRFVNLQAELLAGEDQRRAGVRAGGSAQQHLRLLGQARRVAGEVQRHEVLVAGLSYVAAVRGRVRAHLALLAVDGHHRDSPAALGQALAAQSAFGRGEQLVRAARVEAGEREGHAGRRSQPGVGRGKHPELVCE